MLATNWILINRAKSYMVVLIIDNVLSLPSKNSNDPPNSFCASNIIFLLTTHSGRKHLTKKLFKEVEHELHSYVVNF